MSRNKKLFTVLLSVAAAVCILAASVIILNSQFTARETHRKFRRAPIDFPSLNYVTVPEMKDILQKDTAAFKVIAFLDAADTHTLWTDNLTDSIIPKWQTSGHGSVSLYIITPDCARLKGTESLLSGLTPDCHAYVIRDNSGQFRCYGSLFPDKTRLSRLLRAIAPSENMEMIYSKTSFFNSVTLDRHNNVKLARLECSSSTSTRSIIVPMPFELIGSLESTDFFAIDLIPVGNQSPGLLFCYFFDMK